MKTKSKGKFQTIWKTMQEKTAHKNTAERKQKHYSEENIDSKASITRK